MALTFRPKKKNPYGMDDRIPNGQYRDQLVSNVVKQDPKYLDWLWAVCEFDFTPEVIKAMREHQASAAKNVMTTEKLEAEADRILKSGRR